MSENIVDKAVEKAEKHEELPVQASTSKLKRWNQQ